MAGLTSDGRVTILRLADVLEQIDDELRDSLGADIRLDGDSVLGQVRAAPAIQASLLWEAFGQLGTALDPDQATGELLDGIVALSGVRPRLEPVPSTGQVTLTGTPNALLPAGVRLRGATSGVIVETVAPVTLQGGSATVGVRALEAGPLVVPAADLTQIVTPYAGLTSATNAAALVPGRDRESDLALRARREASLQGTGGGTDGGIRAALLELAEVAQAVVISNRTLTTLPSGQTGKSVRCILWPDTADPAVEGRIARVLAGPDGVRAGIEAYGTDVTATVTLDTGQSYAVRWDYASAVPIYVDATLTLGPLAPAGVQAQVQAAIEDYLSAPLIGEDVRVLKLLSIVQAVSPEILSVTLLLDTVTPPVGTTDITIAEDEIAQVGAVVVT
jgi:hypothetical protein